MGGVLVPKFFFHVHDDLDARDHDGAELPDVEAAMLHALAGARSLAAEQVAKGYLNLAHEIVVEDEAHALLFKLPFGEAVDVKGLAGAAGKLASVRSG
jgi:hypothetical protein